MFEKMKVSSRLYLMFAVMAVFMIGIGVLGVKTAKDVDDDLDTVYKDRVVPLKDLKVIADMYAVNIVDTSHKVRNGNLKWAEGRKNVEEAAKTIEEKWKAYLATYLVEEEKKIADETIPMMKKADAAVAKLRSIMEKEDSGTLAKFTIEELYPAIDPVSEKFVELVDIQIKVAKEEYDKGVKEYEVSRMISIVSIVLGVALSALLAVLLIRNLSKQLGGEPAHIAEIADRIAEGDLSVAFGSEHKAERGQRASDGKDSDEVGRRCP